MTPPPYYGQQPPPPGNDKVSMWGILGIIFAICCWPLGIVFGVLGLLEARKVGKPPTLAYIAFGIIVLRAIWDIIATSTGIYSDWINV